MNSLNGYTARSAKLSVPVQGSSGMGSWEKARSLPVAAADQELHPAPSHTLLNLTLEHLSPNLTLDHPPPHLRDTAPAKGRVQGWSEEVVGERGTASPGVSLTYASRRAGETMGSDVFVQHY